MVSNAKLYTKLDSLEAQLLESLVPHLLSAADGNNEFLFCVRPFNSSRKLKHRTDSLTEELIDIGSLVLSLREKLGESSEGTVAERLCWYCREWVALERRQSGAARVLAKQFLSEIKCLK